MRSASVDNKKQSSFMPIFQNAETEIKVLIVLAFLFLWSEYSLRLKIKAIVDKVAKELQDQPDKAEYINGLKASANKAIFENYRKPVSYFQGQELGIKNPAQAMKYEAKGSVRVKDYAKEIKKKMAELASAPFTTDELGKKPISLWQKAELDVRYEHNLNMIKDQIDQGIDLCWLSSHPDCSKRCEKWQGKLVSLTKHSTMSGFRVGKVDGIWVYSLPDIMAQTDKYGYHNNIISGFNCRHHTIPYHGQKAPTPYSKEDVKKERYVEDTIRKMERDIRKAKQYQRFLEEAGDLSGAKLQKMKVRGMVERYKAFCEKNGYAWEKYRITI